MISNNYKKSTKTPLYYAEEYWNYAVPSEYVENFPNIIATLLSSI